MESWTCPACSTVNLTEATSCTVCGASRAASSAPTGSVPVVPVVAAGSATVAGGATPPPAPVTPPAATSPSAATSHGSGQQFGVIGAGGVAAAGAASAPAPAPADGGGSGRTVAIAVACTVAVIAVLAVLAVVALKPFDDSNSDNATGDPAGEITDDPSVGSDSVDTTVADPVETSVSQAPTTTLPPPTTAAPTTAPPVDPQATALAALQQTQRADAGEVDGVLDYWIPQISSKRPGLEADGIVYQNDTILRNHENLVDRFGAERVALIWSGDFSTFESRDFWVTVVLRPSTDPQDALSWCVNNGLDAKNCNAKKLSHTQGTSDSTERLPGA